MDIAILIPARNEAEKIAETVRCALGVEGVTRVVVVDDGSEDDTATLAEKAGAKVVRIISTAGKGGALEAGASRVASADVIVLLDADLGETASQAAALITPILAGDADMAIATFPPAETKAGFGFVVNLARRGIARYREDFEPAAPLSGQRALTRECFRTVRPFMPGYGAEVGMTIRALRAGFRLREVPTTMAHTATGRDLGGFLHRGRQFVHVQVALSRLRREPARVRTDDPDAV